MLDSTKKVLELSDIGMTCRELQAVCLGYKDNDLELFNYYASFLEWLFPKWDFAVSEAEITNNLQKEIWEKERIERESSNWYREVEIAAYEAEKASERTEIEVTEKEYVTPFEKVLDFNFFGYNIFFCLEIAKTT